LKDSLFKRSETRVYFDFTLNVSPENRHLAVMSWCTVKWSWNSISWMTCHKIGNTEERRQCTNDRQRPPTLSRKTSKKKKNFS